MTMKVKNMTLTMADIAKVSDVLCITEPRGGGAVTVLANMHGENCLQRVFPNWDIPWEPNTFAFPPDWLHAIFPVPALAGLGSHRLPSINGDIPLEMATPVQLTFLLAVAANKQGARAVMWDEDGKPQLRLFVPPRGNN
jgi:hypothetical protein